MGLSGKFCDLACTCGGADRGHMLSNSGEKFASGNAFVSGDWRRSRWCTVEVSSHRLGSKSVMSVREECDEKYSVLSTPRIGTQRSYDMAQHFKDLIVWQKAMEMVAEIYRQ